MKSVVSIHFLLRSQEDKQFTHLPVVANADLRAHVPVARVQSRTNLVSHGRSVSVAAWPPSSSPRPTRKPLVRRAGCGTSGTQHVLAQKPPHHVRHFVIHTAFHTLLPLNRQPRGTFLCTRLRRISRERGHSTPHL